MTMMTFRGHTILELFIPAITSWLSYFAMQCTKCICFFQWHSRGDSTCYRYCSFIMLYIYR